MMKVSLDFEVGNITCATSPGKFCRFLRVSHLGTRHSCALFLDKVERTSTPLRENDQGWLERCPDCLEAFPPEVAEEKRSKEEEDGRE